VRTVDEVAAEVGLTVRTVRYYQSQGLLPPPARVGREARYGDEHLDRLRLISRLQEQGLRLTAIAELLRQGDAAADWLGLTESLTQPWSEDRPALWSEAELHERLARTPGVLVTADDLVRGGVVERRSDTSPVMYLVPSPGMVDVALQLAALGIDLDVAARLRTLLVERLRALATDLVATFTDEVSLTLLADGERGPGDLVRLLEQLRPLTRRSVDLLFASEMERAQRELLAAVDVPATDPAIDPATERSSA
jgi:DNA-binding transcriptional MerR regulator